MAQLFSYLAQSLSYQAWGCHIYHELNHISSCTIYYFLLQSIFYFFVCLYQFFCFKQISLFFNNCLHVCFSKGGTGVPCSPLICSCGALDVVLPLRPWWLLVMSGWILGNEASGGSVCWWGGQACLPN